MSPGAPTKAASNTHKSNFPPRAPQPKIQYVRSAVDALSARFAQNFGDQRRASGSRSIQSVNRNTQDNPFMSSQGSSQPTQGSPESRIVPSKRRAVLDSDESGPSTPKRARIADEDGEPPLLEFQNQDALKEPRSLASTSSINSHSANGSLLLGERGEKPKKDAKAARVAMKRAVSRKVSAQGVGHSGIAGGLVIYLYLVILYCL